MKRYAPKNSGKPAPTHDLEFVFLRDGVEEVHTFFARPLFGWKETTGAISLMGLAEGNTEHGELVGGMRYVENVIRRSLVNDDGTPEKWAATVVDGHFTDPNGDHAPESMLPLYEAFDTGSSRRRWVHLMVHDDDVTFERDQLMELFADLMEVAGARPTERSEASSL